MLEAEKLYGHNPNSPTRCLATLFPAAASLSDTNLLNSH